MNHLLELITPNNIIYDLKAKDKESVIASLVEHGVKIGSIANSASQEIITSLLNREKSMSTGIGSGVAIPHCSVSLVEDLKVVIGLSKEGIAFDAIDKMPVHIFILLIVPKNKFQEHIKTLALIAKTLNLKEERNKMICSNSYDDILAAFSQ
ncbi:MAG TPA: PTS sugar transporter subunit IIA [Leptospiraceae bacterium]|nr:PTS sugar transporter subunit IIA [Leptospiraceae bacterium]HMW05438.1 PTS sugar transporter subunit IIA [Leptospiraceae bacterium]HMX31413.1 PTS sugar transporter subunit IIA [Leptospiraceae bacterium]HMY30948.1 PTS sugar transporter subunit IIA [Leptospiraceae bacterium]HMZ63359.1 PTS sugar transporter subunit IIA [Leptospiraceae bacterium]